MRSFRFEAGKILCRLEVVVFECVSECGAQSSYKTDESIVCIFSSRTLVTAHGSHDLGAAGSHVTISIGDVLTMKRDTPESFWPITQW